MVKQGSMFWVVAMWTCYGAAMGAVIVQRWWIVPIGWVASTISAVRT